MPTHNHNYYDQNKEPAPLGLVEGGPVLQVEISVATELAEHLTRQRQSVPKPVSGWALVDTGATRTAIDERAVEQLALNSIDTVTLATASGSREAGVYACVLHFASGAIPNITAARATGVDLAGQDLDGKPIIALIGRDVLVRCVFVYNGTMGQFSLSV